MHLETLQIGNANSGFFYFPVLQFRKLSYTLCAESICFQIPLRQNSTIQRTREKQAFKILHTSNTKTFDSYQLPCVFVPGKPNFAIGAFAKGLQKFITTFHIMTVLVVSYW